MLSHQKIQQVSDLLTLAQAVAKRDATRLRLAENDSDRLSAEIEALRHKPTRTSAKPKPQIIKCTKRPFDSEAAAVRSCTQLKHTVKAYPCPHCLKWHITKADFA